MARINNNFWNNLWTEAQNIAGQIRSSARKAWAQVSSWSDMANQQTANDGYTRSSSTANSHLPQNSYMLDADGYKINSAGQRISDRPIAPPTHSKTNRFWNWLKNTFGGGGKGPTNAGGTATANSGGFINWLKGVFGGGGSGGGGGGNIPPGSAGKGSWFKALGGKGTLIGALISVAFGAVDGYNEAHHNAQKEGYSFWKRPFKWMGDFLNRFSRSTIVGLGSLLAGAVVTGLLGGGFLVGLGVSAVAGYFLNNWINSPSGFPTPTREEMNLEEIRQQKACEAKENAKKLVDSDKMLIHMDPNDILNAENFDEIEKFLDASVYRVNSGNFVPIFDDRSTPSPFDSIKLSECN